MNDLHRHMGGSISIKTVNKITGMPINEIKTRMLYQPGEERNFQNFLNKFKILDTIQWDKDSLQYMMSQVVCDILLEDLSYVELKFTLDKYVRPDWSPKEVLKWIISCNPWPGIIALVPSLKYEAPHQAQIEVAKLIEDPEVMHNVVGIDLVGDESYFDTGFYMEILKPWKEAGKGIEAHVGETGPVENVVNAIDKLGVDRVAHGIAVVEYPEVMRLACKKNICFDVAITSNYYTGVADLDNHPVLDMVNAGCSVTIGTDDPVILNTSLAKEFFLARKIGLVEEQIKQFIVNSERFAFRNR